MWAEAYGNLFQSDSLARGSYDVTFDASQKLRYIVYAHSDTSYGYNTGSVRLQGSSGTVFQVSGDYGSWNSIVTKGWIDAGSYTLEGEVEAQSYASSGNPDDQHGNAECDFKVFHAADYDLDGDVDAADKASFKSDYLSGSPEADYNGDGVTNFTDWKQFRKAWNNA